MIVSIESHVIVPRELVLYQQLHQLAMTQYVICVAGLPGTGKSLIIHQLAHLALGHGREVSLLQWDVVRPTFEASPAGARYPVIDGVTQGVIRKAVGLWARDAIARWDQVHSEPRHLLLVETPLIGHRLIEFARIADDATELLLSGDTACFVVPVPSRWVRQVIEDQREQRSYSPRHHRETEDAPPNVLQALWHDVVRIAPEIGVGMAADSLGEKIPYDPDIYCQAYQAILYHRRCEVITVDTILPTSEMSPYEFASDIDDLIPTCNEATAYIQTVETLYPDLEVLDREVSDWFLV